MSLGTATPGDPSPAGFPLCCAHRQPESTIHQLGGTWQPIKAGHHWHPQPYSPLNMGPGKALCRRLSSLRPQLLALCRSLQEPEVLLHAWVSGLTCTLALEVKHEKEEKHQTPWLPWGRVCCDQWSGRQNPPLMPAEGSWCWSVGHLWLPRPQGWSSLGTTTAWDFSRTEISQVRQKGNLLLFWSEWELLLCCSLLLTRHCIMPALLHPSNDAIFSIGRRQSASA